MKLNRVEGPECPRCGCRDCGAVPGGGKGLFDWEGLVPGESGGGGGRLGRFGCNHCGQVFSARVVDEVGGPGSGSASPGDAGVVGSAVYERPFAGGAVCPGCGCFPAKVRRTMPADGGPRIRYHVCDGCGATFKSVESVGK